MRHALSTIAVVLLLLAGVSCNLPRNLSGEEAPTATPPPTPTLIPSSTPIPTPTFTPTPRPEERTAEGEQAIFAGDWERSQEEFETALEQAASDSAASPEIAGAALLGIGRTYYLSGDFPKALDALREVSESYPSTPELAATHFFLGRVYDSLQRYQEAAKAYEQYTILNPEILDHYMFRYQGDALFNAGDYPAAIAAYQKAIASTPSGETLDLQMKLAQSWWAAGDLDTAMTIYEQVYLATGNDFTKALIDYLRGQALLSIGLAEEGYASLQHAVENYPLSYDTYLALVQLVEAGIPVNEFDRGLVDYYAGQYGVAIAAFDRYLVANPDDHGAAPHYYRGLALRAIEDYAGAVEAFDAAIADHTGEPNWVEAWDEKAFTLWAYLNDYQAAAQTYLDFAAAFPEHPQAPVLLESGARILERSGSLDRAATTWEQVAVSYPTSGQAFRSMFLAGITRYRMNQYAEANQLFQRALGLAPSLGEQAAVQLWIGKSEQNLGQDAAAAAAFERASLLDPTGYYSERARDLLLGRTPFQPPESYDTGIDWEAERLKAEQWIKDRFAMPPETDLSGPGPLIADGRLQRGTELWNLGLYEESRLEFEDLRRSIQTNPELNYRLANYLVELGLYRTAIFAAREVLNLAGLDDAGTMTAPLYFNLIRFGTYYNDLVAPLAEAYGFHPLFIYSVMRQESLFEGFIRSSAGARGLMQIIPSTGQYIHELNGWPPDYTPDDLYRPKVSLTFGTDHLADLEKTFAGDRYAALAAYNAGPGNASVWKELAPTDLDLYLEVIRFEETRNYIRGIYEIYTIYRNLYDRSP